MATDLRAHILAQAAGVSQIALTRRAWYTLDAHTLHHRSCAHAGEWVRLRGYEAAEVIAGWGEESGSLTRRVLGGAYACVEGCLAETPAGKGGAAIRDEARTYALASAIETGQQARRLDDTLVALGRARLLGAQRPPRDPRLRAGLESVEACLAELAHTLPPGHSSQIFTPYGVSANWREVLRGGVGEPASAAPAEPTGAQEASEGTEVWVITGGAFLPPEALVAIAGGTLLHAGKRWVVFSQRRNVADALTQELEPVGWAPIDTHAQADRDEMIAAACALWDGVEDWAETLQTARNCLR